MTEFESKVALVTGGSRGIGATVARQFAAAGYRLAVTSTDGTSAEAFVRELGLPEGLAVGIGARFEDRAAVAATVPQVLNRFGRIDILVNNAGVSSQQRFMDLTLPEWDRVVGVNLTAMILLSQASARDMKLRRWGRIINLGSFFGSRAVGGRTSYGTSKAAITQLTRQMAIELSPDGVTVNCVAPGVILTEMTQRAHTPEARAIWERNVPVGRYGNPEEVAAAIGFLASVEAGYISGETLHVDGGANAALAYFGTGI